MKYLNALLSPAAALLLAASAYAQAPQPGGQTQAPPGEGQRGPGGRGGGRAGGRGGFFGPQLPPEQQTEVDRIVAALDAESKAITSASSNLVVATFSTPADKEKIARANDELTKARAAWAAKASKLFAETQASDKKLSQDAINRLVMMSSGGGRGFGRGGFGGPGGPGIPGGEGSGRRGGRGQQ